MRPTIETGARSFDGIVGQVAVDIGRRRIGARRAERERIAVGCGPYDLPDSDRAIGTWAILDHDRLPKPRGEIAGDDAGDQIRCASRRIGHYEGDGASAGHAGGWACAKPGTTSASRMAFKQSIVSVPLYRNFNDARNFRYFQTQRAMLPPAGFRARFKRKPPVNVTSRDPSHDEEMPINLEVSERKDDVTEPTELRALRRTGSGRKIIDISLELDATKFRMRTYEGFNKDMQFDVEVIKDYPGGLGQIVRGAHMRLHAGTHVDAPVSHGAGRQADP